MEIRWALVVMALAMAVAIAQAGTSYTVGAPDGLWDMHTDYADWVSRRTFHPGDNITFTYSRELHDVVEVGKAGYDACSSANNISAFRSGNDLVALAAPGTRYFLCGLTGHCANGMKIAIRVVDVVASAGGPNASPPVASSAVVVVGGLGAVVMVAAQALALVLAVSGMSFFW